MQLPAEVEDQDKHESHNLISFPERLELLPALLIGIAEIQQINFLETILLNTSIPLGMHYKMVLSPLLSILSGNRNPRDEGV